MPDSPADDYIYDPEEELDEDEGEEISSEEDAEPSSQSEHSPSRLTRGKDALRGEVQGRVTDKVTEKAWRGGLRKGTLRSGRIVGSAGAEAGVAEGAAVATGTTTATTAVVGAEAGAVAAVEGAAVIAGEGAVAAGGAIAAPEILVGLVILLAIILLIAALFIFILFVAAILISIFKQYPEGGGELEVEDGPLAIEKTVTPDRFESITAPTVVTYTLKVTNNTENEITDIQLDDTLLDESKCSFVGQTLASGASATCTYEHTIQPSQTQSLVNNVSVTGTGDGELLTASAGAVVHIGALANDVPCGSPIPGATLTQGCGGRHATINIAGSGNAIDLAGVRIGTAVLATHSGTAQRCVISNVNGRRGSYGIQVILRNERYQTRYAHLQKRDGDPAPGGNAATGNCGPAFEVVAGQQIGEMGNTGNSTGAHLHYEIQSLDPRALICPINGTGGTYLDGTAQECQAPPAPAASPSPTPPPRRGIE